MTSQEYRKIYNQNQQLHKEIAQLKQQIAGLQKQQPAAPAVANVPAPAAAAHISTTSLMAAAAAAQAAETPPPVAAAVFRLAQESVTNALRHARQVTRVDVRVEADAGGVRLRVTNDGDVAASPTPGFGIIGMRERAALLGGACEAGPASGGGWIVNAVLPRAGWAP